MFKEYAFTGCILKVYHCLELFSDYECKMFETGFLLIKPLISLQIIKVHFKGLTKINKTEKVYV